jgi:hypothetical protein
MKSQVGMMPGVVNIIDQGWPLIGSQPIFTMAELAVLIIERPTLNTIPNESLGR